jgi:CHASE2 domain-containing sensor protein
MLLRVWRFATVMLAGLTLTMTSAHVLELPQKMQYDAQMYSAVNTTLYRYFAVVGGAYTVSSILAAFVLAFLLRRRRQPFRLTLAGAICLLLAFGSWLILVAPVNNEIAQALATAPENVPLLWMQLRERWEYGHALGFIITLTGFGLLVFSLLIEIPEHPSGDVET